MDETTSIGELDEIPESECWEILKRHRLGRIAVVVDGQPEIFPVNYAMSGRIVTLWLQADHEALTGKILKLPERSEIDTPVQESLIVELYSK